MLCTNPDTCLDVDGTRLRFAGLVTAHYRALGGTVIDIGTPEVAIYAQAMEAARTVTGQRYENDRVTGFGDALVLDAAGALAQGFAAA